MIDFQSATYLKGSSRDNSQNFYLLISVFKDALELLFKETSFIAPKHYLLKY